MKHEWVLKKNCSLAPRQLALAYAVLCFFSFGIALMFLLAGTWHVLAFAVMEMTVVALAFIHYARHSTDHEYIVLIDDCLLVERVQAGRVHQVRMEPYWTRIVLRSRNLIGLEAKGVKIEVGRFVTEAKRLQVAQELRGQLRGGIFM